MKHFKNIEIGELLEYNGVLYKKKTSKTCIMLHNKRVFYFRKNDECSTDDMIIKNIKRWSKWAMMKLSLFYLINMD